MQALAEEFRVVDTDTHIIEPYDLWTARMSVRKWGDKVPHVKWDDVRQEDAWYFGEERVFSACFSAHAGWTEYFPDTPKRLSDVSPSLWRAEDRLQLMDAYGIHSQILFPNVAGFGAGRYLALTDPVLMLECLQAYNDWLTDWASAAPTRFIPQMAMPIWDVDACVAEMARCVRMGHKGVVMSAEPSAFGLPKLSDPHWDVMWAAAEEMGLPVNFHVASGDPGAMDIITMIHPSAGPRANSASMNALAALDNAKAISQLICAGICHRFPRLNFVSVESGVGWLPFVLDGLDYQWKNCAVGREHPEYDLLPSEYFRRQIYSCFWFEEETLRSSIEQLGADNILYETDFPHPTSMSPGPASVAIRPGDYIEKAFAGVSREDAGKILHGNAARIYHLN
jgi:predicted TIM-barrel fold metal-dependent hydrolase